MIQVATLHSGQIVHFWTAAAVEERLREALTTLSRLPLTERDYPAQLKSNWGAVVQRLEDWLPIPGEENFQQKWKAAREMLAEERNRPPRFVPTAAAITRMEEALSWQRFVSPRRHWQALAAYCLGESAGRTARRLRVGRETVRRWRNRAICQIASALNGG